MDSNKGDNCPLYGVLILEGKEVVIEAVEREEICENGRIKKVYTVKEII